MLVRALEMALPTRTRCVLPVSSTCEKAEQPLDQRWVDRHGQEFVDHEMWLDTVESAAEVSEEDSCVCLLPVKVFI